MKKLKAGFWGLHRCSMLKHYCDGANALARERQGAASWKRAGKRFSELKH